MNDLLSFDSNSQIVSNDDYDCGDDDDACWKISDHSNDADNHGTFNVKQKDGCISSDSHSHTTTKRKKPWKIIKKKYRKFQRRRGKQHSKHGDLSQADDKMVVFFQTVHSIQNNIDVISTNTKKILGMKDEAMQAKNSAEEEEISQKLNVTISETNQTATKAKGLISLLKGETEHLKKKGSIRSSDLRVRDNLCNAVVRKFVEATQNCREAEEQYKIDLKRKVSRQIRIAMPSANDDDIEMIIKSGKEAKESFIQQMLLGNVASDLIQSMYNSVSHKYHDILSLEEHINELYQMYLDFAILTEQQGEVLDHIEYQVQIVNEDIVESNDNIHKSIKHQKEIRKKQCIIIGIIVVVIIVVTIAILV